MKKVCPICKTQVSKKWIYLSSSTSYYTCSHCHAIINWNISKHVFHILGFTISFLLIFLLKSTAYNHSVVGFFISAAIFLLCYTIIAVVIPAILFPLFTKANSK